MSDSVREAFEAQCNAEMLDTRKNAYGGYEHWEVAERWMESVKQQKLDPTRALYDAAGLGWLKYRTKKGKIIDGMNLKEADAEWRGVVEKLVEALEYVEANYDGMNKAAIVRQALAQAEKFMGRK